MDSVNLGTQGLKVSRVGLGCMNLSMGYSTAPTEDDAVRLLQRAVGLGVTFFDTAEMYGPFKNEILVGKALRPVREQVVIATKFGFDIRPNELRPAGLNSRPEHIRQVCDESLARLGVEHIDLLYQHRVDPHIPIEDVAGTVGELVKVGKVRYFGLSEASAATLRRAHRVQPVSALQSEYSLWSRSVEGDLLPTCRQLGVGFVAYSPLGRGFLAGAGKGLTADDPRRGSPRWQGTALDHNVACVEALTQIAQRKHCSLGQLAIAWLLHRGPDVVPIPGTNKLARLEENAAATAVQLSDKDVAWIEELIPPEAIEGNRYDAVGDSLIDR